MRAVAVLLLLAVTLVVPSAAPRHAPVPTSACTRAAAPDFNGDGTADLVGIDPYNDMYLYGGDGHGNLTSKSAMWPLGGLWWGYHAIAAADFTGDGRADLAGVDPYGDLWMFTGDGAGHLGATVRMWPAGGTFTGYRFLVAGDFDSDGRADVAGVDGSSNLRLWVGDGGGHVSGGTLMWPAGGGWAGFVDIVAADFTGDGLPDIAGVNAFHDVGLYVGDGAGHLVVAGAGAAMWPTGGLWGGFTHLAAADFDGDGFADLPGVNAFHDVGLYRGDGTGHLVVGSGGYMWPGGGQWVNFHALTAAGAAAGCSAGRAVIVPLGDSITYGTGSSSGDGYRGPLAGLLNTVAPMGSRWLYEGSYASGGRWWSHQSFGGATIDQIRGGVSGWLASARNAGLPPTLVLLDAGTNDAGQGRSGGQLLDSMSALLDALLAAPDVRVVVAQVTITTGDTSAQQAAEAGFDEGLPPLAASKGPRVAVVDMRGVALSGDRLHPADAGYQDMAGRWYAALAAQGWLPTTAGPTGQSRRG